MSASCPKCFSGAFKIFYDSIGKPVAKCVECGTETPFTKAAFGVEPPSRQTEERAIDAPKLQKVPRPSS